MKNGLELHDFSVLYRAGEIDNDELFDYVNGVMKYDEKPS